MSTNCMVRPYRPSMLNFIFLLLVPWHEGAFNLFGYPFIDVGCYFCCYCLFLVVWSSYIILINSKSRLRQTDTLIWTHRHFFLFPIVTNRPRQTRRLTFLSGESICLEVRTIWLLKKRVNCVIGLVETNWRTGYYCFRWNLCWSHY